MRAVVMRGDIRQHMRRVGTPATGPGRSAVRAQGQVRRATRSAVLRPIPAPNAVFPTSMILASLAASPERSPAGPYPSDGNSTNSGNTDVATP